MDKPEESFSSLLDAAQTEIKGEELKSEQDAARLWQEQQDKKREVMEKIAPLVSKYNELKWSMLHNPGFIVAQFKYAALKDNKDHFEQIDNTCLEQDRLLADMYDTIAAEYKSAGGTEDIDRIIAGRSRVSLEESVKNGASRSNFDWYKNHLTDTKSPIRTVIDPIASNPEEFVTKLQGNAVDRNKEYKNPQKFGQGDKEALRNNLRMDFEATSQGFGIAALESGDVEVSAKALALGEVLGKMPLDVMEKAQSILSKMAPDLKKQFINKFKEEKAKVAQVLSR